MNIQGTEGYGVHASQNVSSRLPISTPDNTTSAASAPTKVSDTVTISSEAKELLAAQSTSAITNNKTIAEYDTAEGAKQLDIDDYFSHKDRKLSLLGPLLLPTQKNINALSDHISATLPNLLHQYGIPSGPTSFTYDNQGQIQLPEDYQYATEFELMLEDNPTFARQLSTINALASHLSGMKKAMAFQQEYSMASTQAEAKAITDKYNYLFSNIRQYDQITLGFAADGSLNVNVNGELLG